jgi:hypothetical protein
MHSPSPFLGDDFKSANIDVHAFLANGARRYRECENENESPVTNDHGMTPEIQCAASQGALDGTKVVIPEVVEYLPK